MIVKGKDQTLPSTVSAEDLFSLFLGSKYKTSKIASVSAFDKSSPTNIETIKQQSIKTQDINNYLIKFDDIDMKRTCCTRARNQHLADLPIKLRKCENLEVWQDADNKILFDFEEEKSKQIQILKEEKLKIERKNEEERKLKELKELAELEKEAAAERQRQLSNESEASSKNLEYFPSMKKAKLENEESAAGSAAVISPPPSGEVKAEAVHESPNTQLLKLRNNYTINLSKSVKLVTKMPAVQHQENKFPSLVSPPSGMSTENLDESKPILIQPLSLRIISCPLAQVARLLG